MQANKKRTRRQGTKTPKQEEGRIDFSLPLLKIHQPPTETESKTGPAPATAAKPPAPGVASSNPNPQAFLAPTEGVIRVWICTNSEAYKLQLAHLGPDGSAWTFTKWSDGTTYRVHETDGDTHTCTCPGHQNHGPKCNNGKGCKHRRMLQALRQVVDPGI